MKLFNATTLLKPRVKGVQNNTVAKERFYNINFHTRSHIKRFFFSFLLTGLSVMRDDHVTKSLHSNECSLL